MTSSISISGKEPIITSSSSSPLLTLPAMANDIERVNEELRNSVQSDDSFLTEVAIHLINAETPLDKELGIGDGYKYDHDSKEGFIKKDNFPERIFNKDFYRPNSRGLEIRLKERFEKLWLQGD